MITNYNQPVVYVQRVIIPKKLSVGSTRPNRLVKKFLWPFTKCSSRRGRYKCDFETSILYNVKPQMSLVPWLRSRSHICTCQASQNTRPMSNQQIYVHCDAPKSFKALIFGVRASSWIDFDLFEKIHRYFFKNRSGKRYNTYLLYVVRSMFNIVRVCM